MTSTPVEIDVLVVCQHDADMVKRCLTSAKEGATNTVRLHVWQNGEDDELSGVISNIVSVTRHFSIVYSPDNAGFIHPNNILAKKGTAPYLCLLNADTICAPGWDVPLIDALTRPGTPVDAIVGYSGGWLSADGVGRHAAFPGAPVDYVEGWCLMTTRALWEALGGFDEQHLTMAYGEDSDLCLRAREMGYSVAQVSNEATDHYGPLGSLAPETRGHWVYHLRDADGGKGASPETRKSPELQAAMVANHAYLQERHKAYLASGRVLVKDYKRPYLRVKTQGHGTDYSASPVLDASLIGHHRSDVHVNVHEVDGRLWELDFGGHVARFLVP